MFIPFRDKGHQSLRQVLLVRKISDPQPLALQRIFQDSAPKDRL